MEKINYQNEESLLQQLSLVQKQTKNIQISDDIGYRAASEILKKIKQNQKNVKEFFEPLRIASKEAYDQILCRKKQMLEPLETAEKALKSEIGYYVERLEQQQRVQDSKARQLAEKEMETNLQKAAICEQNGDAYGAECAMVEAEIMDAVANSGEFHPYKPKANGVSISKGWKITNIQEDKVPTVINNVIIRPVDEKAVLRAIKEAKGNIVIPGIKFEEEAKISVRT